MPFIDCKLCKKDFSGPEPFAQHLVSKAHIQKLEEQGLDKSHLQAANDTVQKEQYKCGVCDVDLSGPVPLEQHFKGSKHKSMLNKKRILQEQGTPNSDLSLTCDTCEKCFSGPESYEAHIKSKKHQRKLEMSDMKSRLTNQEAPSCPPMNDIQHDINDQKISYPSLPKEMQESVIPNRAQAQAPIKKKPTGCFSALRRSFKKKDKFV